MSITPMAFPDAVGFGRFATGGRGETVFDVTNTDNSGTGSLRDALAAAGTAGGGYIRLTVEGHLEAGSQLDVPANVTIDGRFAPGTGFTVTRSRLNIRGSNTICVGLQAMAGSEYGGQSYGDRDSISIGIYNGDPNAGTPITDVYLRSCTVGAGTDESLTIYTITGSTFAANAHRVERVTFDRVAMPWQAGNGNLHVDENRTWAANHSDAVLVGSANGRVTFYRCVIANTEYRAPAIQECPEIEMVNCVLANCGDFTEVTWSGATVHIRGCVYVVGPLSTSGPTRKAILGGGSTRLWETNNHFGGYDASGWNEALLQDGPQTAGSSAALFTSSGADAGLMMDRGTIVSTVLGEAGSKLRNGSQHPAVKLVRGWLEERPAFTSGPKGIGSSHLRPFASDLDMIDITTSHVNDDFTVTLPAPPPAPEGMPWTGARITIWPVTSRGLELGPCNEDLGTSTPGITARRPTALGASQEATVAATLGASHTFTSADPCMVRVEYLTATGHGLRFSDGKARGTL